MVQFQSRIKVKHPGSNNSGKGAYPQLGTWKSLGNRKIRSNLEMTLRNFVISKLFASANKDY